MSLYRLVVATVAITVIPMFVLGLVALLRANADDLPAICEQLGNWFWALLPWGRL